MKRSCRSAARPAAVGQHSRRHDDPEHGRGLAVGVAALALLAGCSGSGAHPADPAAPVASQTPDRTASPRRSWMGWTPPAASARCAATGIPLPIRIIIPKIGVASSLDRLGRAPDGTVEVPGPDRWRCPAGMSSARDRASSGQR